MNEGPEDKGVGKEDKANDKVTEATEDKEKEKMPDAEAKGGGDEPDADGIAESSGAGDPSHGEGVMKPNSDADGDAGKMDEGEPPPKADERIVCTDKEEGNKEVDEPMEEGEQGGEARPSEDVDDKPATPSDTSVAVAQGETSNERTRDEHAEQGGFGCNAKALDLATSAVTSRHARSKTTSCKGLSLRRLPLRRILGTEPFLTLPTCV